MTAPVALPWRRRDVALPESGVIACGDAARRLARRLLDRSDADLRLVTAAVAQDPASGEDVLVVLGPADALPWTPDAVLIGRDPAASALLMPVHDEPAIPADLVLAALCRLRPGIAVPLAVIPQRRLAVSCAAAARPGRDELQRRFPAASPEP